MNEPLVITHLWTIPPDELRERFSRAGGPGGQGVNTTDSRVQLSFDVSAAGSIPDHLRARMLARLESRLVEGVLTITASQHRSQRANRMAARERLAGILRDAAAPPGPTRRPTRPSRSSQVRRVDAKRRRSALKAGRRGEFD